MSLRKLVLVAAIAVAPACGSVAASPDAASPDAAPRDVKCDSTSDKFLPNASFDLATPAWKQETTPVVAGQSLLCGSSITPADGTLAACMGGRDGQIQSLSQTVALPAGAKTVTLTGQKCITTVDTDAVDNDVLEFELLEATTVIATFGQFSNQDGARDCQFTAFSPLVATLTDDPPEATLRLRATLNTLKTTSFFIDALKLDVTCAAP